MNKHPVILRLKPEEEGKCFVCEETKTLSYIDKELKDVGLNASFCNDCLKMVAMADYNLNKTKGYCRPTSK